MIDISVIIPCYNRQDTICNAINSVLKQTFDGNIQIIVSDDGSSDKSISLVKENYSSEKVILLEKPLGCSDQGASGARNRGIQVATGKYIAFLDSDDYYYCDFLQTLYDVIEKDASLGYVFCRVEQEMRDKDGTQITAWTRTKMNLIDQNYHVLNRAHCICTICQLIRKDVLLMAGLFDTTLKVGEDSDMWIRISEITKGKFIDYIGIVYCIEGFSNNQLTVEQSYKKNDYARLVYERALYRYKMQNNKDRIRLALIYKSLYMCMANQGGGLLNKLKRQCYVFFNMFFRVPIETIIIYYYNIK